MQNFNYNLHQYDFVNGLEGAKAYKMLPNQMVMLLDSDNPIIYKKTSDNFGKAVIECFKMVSISEQELKDIVSPPQPEYVIKSDFDALLKRIDALTKEEKK